MINIGNHTKTNEPPVGIAITWVEANLIQWYKSLERFERYLQHEFSKDDCQWPQIMKNKPKHEVAYVYIIIGGVVKYRVNYVGYEDGKIIMTGPLLIAPAVLEKKGFQGFRYTSFLF
jgi:hypothetical protein